jgi:hypothetical protein
VNGHTQMKGVGEVSFRTGGSTGATALLPPRVTAVSRTLRPFQGYYCETCGKFDLYYHGT